MINQSAPSGEVTVPEKKQKNPWSWVPTLYFAQGIPYVVVMTVSVIMYKRLGLSNADIALYTSWLYLPWVLKPLWSPFVDMFGTKRAWIVWLQMVLGIALAAAAVAIPLPSFLAFTLVIFGLMAFSSATHDIAADGFYMLSLDQPRQAAFVGVRSTFYRIAMWAGQGALVVVAGLLEPAIGIPKAWAFTFVFVAALFLSLFAYHYFVLPRPEGDRGSLAGKKITGSQIAVLLGGFALFVAVLTGAYFASHEVFMVAGLTGIWATVLSLLLLVGGAVVAVRTVVGNWVEKRSAEMASEAGGAQTGKALDPFVEFLRAFLLFLRKDNIWVILAFLLLYRFAEAQLVKLVQPFLLDPRASGGLGLTTGDVGIVYGTIGIIALTVGGLTGGYVISRQGLRWWLWPMVIIMHLPDLAFVYLSQVQPQNIFLISTAVGFEQFGYGFGFTAYMMFMIFVSQGQYKTAHYAICTGFMALGMMIPGMFSGALQELIGYRGFFLWVIISTIPGFAVAAMVKIPKDFGRKSES
jgi:MFS transporter, PAT family, beta-lactamase induction signal transducer AmpG